MAGAEIKNEAQYFHRAEVKCETAGTLTLGDKDPTPATGTVFNIFAEDDDCGTDIGEDATVATKTITVADAEKDVTYFVYYECTVNGDNIEMFAINDTTFPKAICVDADTVYKNENDEQIAMKLRVYKCQPQATFTLTHANTGDPGTLTMACDMMADADGNILDMIEILPEA